MERSGQSDPRADRPRLRALRSASRQQRAGSGPRFVGRSGQRGEVGIQRLPGDANAARADFDRRDFTGADQGVDMAGFFMAEGVGYVAGGEKLLFHRAGSNQAVRLFFCAGVLS